MRQNMNKIIFLIIVLFIAAGIIVASFLVHPVILSSVDLTSVKSNCATCHRIPKITNREQIHEAHEFLNCNSCHIGGTDNGERESGEVDNNICVSCHTKTEYTSPVAMHDAHSTTACTACHTESPGLAAANNTHITLRRVGIGLAALVVLGLLINYIVARVRLLIRNKENLD
jgi:hypothetical protein